MGEGISAQGTLIARSADTPPFNFITIAELSDITPPPLMRNPIETTTHNGIEEQFTVGIRRKGELTFSIFWLPSDPTHDHLTGLQQSWQDGARDVWRVTYPDGRQWLFSGYVTNIGPAAPVDDALTADITIRPTGLMTLQ